MVTFTFPSFSQNILWFYNHLVRLFYNLPLEIKNQKIEFENDSFLIVIYESLKAPRIILLNFLGNYIQKGKFFRHYHEWIFKYKLITIQKSFSILFLLFCSAPFFLFVILFLYLQSEFCFGKQQQQRQRKRRRKKKYKIITKNHQTKAAKHKRMKNIHIYMC